MISGVMLVCRLVMVLLQALAVKAADTLISEN